MSPIDLFKLCIATLLIRPSTYLTHVQSDLFYNYIWDLHHATSTPRGRPLSSYLDLEDHQNPPLEPTLASFPEHKFSAPRFHEHALRDIYTDLPL